MRETDYSTICTELNEYLESKNVLDRTYVSAKDYDRLCITATIEGDWKHDHLYFKQLVREFAKSKNLEVTISTFVTDTENSDNYTADYSIVFENDLSESYDLEDDIDDDFETPSYKTCPVCGNRLTDGGDCPVCDLGEEDYGDDDHANRNHFNTLMDTYISHMINEEVTDTDSMMDLLLDASSCKCKLTHWAIDEAMDSESLKSEMHSIYVLIQHHYPDVDYWKITEDGYQIMLTTGKKILCEFDPETNKLIETE